jgi:hypothetical protein
LLFRTTGFSTGDPLSRGGMGNIAQIPPTSTGFIKKYEFFFEPPLIFEGGACFQTAKIDGPTTGCSGCRRRQAAAG